MIHKKNSF